MDFKRISVIFKNDARKSRGFKGDAKKYNVMLPSQFKKHSDVCFGNTNKTLRPCYVVIS